MEAVYSPGWKGSVSKFALFFFIFLLAMVSFTHLLGTNAPLRITSVLFLALVLIRRDWQLIPAAFLIFFLFCGPLFFPAFIWRFPTLPFLGAAFAVTLLSWPFAQLRAQFHWLKKGEIDVSSRLVAVALTFAAAMVLLLWAAFTDNLGMGKGFVRELEGIPLFFLLLVGTPIFAFLNALGEEAIYRGILQGALSRFPHRGLAVLLPATVFAAAHFEAGFPHGKLGYLIALAYGGGLGWLREKTGGIWLPFLVHFAVELLLGIILVMVAV